MITKIFCVYDSKIEAFMKPFFLNHVGSAVRTFEDALQDEKSEFCKHAEDYVLYEIGDFDDSNGSIDILPAPQKVMSGFDVVSSKE